MNKARSILFGALAALVIAAPRDSRATSGADLDHVTDLITQLDTDDAKRALEHADPDDPSVALLRGLIALHENECDAALELVSRPDLVATAGGANIADLARGCARVIAANVVERDDASGVEVRFQDEGDRDLFPLIVETVVLARDALSRDLGATWPKPTRLTMVRDAISLSAMTGLPKEAAMQTGTVAVAKWGKVAILSPRAPSHGYQWRDTLAHELTHLAVTRITRDHAPLWLQEGVAKNEETRWREPSSFDGRPLPESIFARGVQEKLDVPLDGLGMSIAMLPSADRAAVAFAEVTSFVRFYVDHAGADALPRLLRTLKEPHERSPDAGPNDEVNAALVAVSGSDFTQWEAKWRDWLKVTPPPPLQEGWGLGGFPPAARELRERGRLAELLYGRGHAKEALTELDRAPPESTPGTYATIRYLRARVLETLGDSATAEEAIGGDKDVVAAVGVWWAMRARLARARGDEAAAQGFFAAAMATDPLDVEVACESLDPQVSPSDPGARALCDAARARAIPDLGKD